MLSQYLFILKTVSRKQTLKQTLELGGIKLVFVEIYRIVMKWITILFDFLLALFGFVAFMKDDMLSYFILFAGAMLMYIFVLKDYSEEAIIRHFAKKYGFTVAKLEKILLIYYPCVLVLEIAIAALVVILKIIF
ncbi:MAG: hypothetical protein J6D20_06850 [Clostridia bacterium]|nr:hypothetical protein [Clostridia bacterium]